MISGGGAVVNGRELHPNGLLLLDSGAEFKAVVQGNSTLRQIGVSIDVLGQPANRKKTHRSALGVYIFDLSSSQSKNLRLLFARVFSEPNDTEGVLQTARNLDVLCDRLGGDSVVHKHSYSVQRALVLAREYIEAHLEKPLPIPEICAFAGISQRTLERAFAIEFGMSPVQYLRTIRLNEVHRILRKPVEDDDFYVTRVADRFGFNHLGRFSREYKQLYGELPSETLAR